MKSLLVKMLGFPATLIHGDTLVLDRWFWLKQKLAKIDSREKLIDIGCGSGAFTIGASLKGYDAIGLSWDAQNQEKANQRAVLCHAKNVEFEVADVRHLDQYRDLAAKFDTAICLEVVEHILDDRKLLRDIANCLKPGGKLLLTTPNDSYIPIDSEDKGPFLPVETGWHVRKGYNEKTLRKLCEQSGFSIDKVSFCSGFISQKITFLFRKISKIHPILGWVCILPLRILPPVLDKNITKLINWPEYSICIEAHKPQ